jgi:GTP 3',8-cyclase
MSASTFIRILPVTAPSARALPLADGATDKPLDTLNRPLRDLRISVTDRCNFRCTYCMPRSVFTPDYPYLARSELLGFDEITRMAQIAVNLGVEKIRLTGGEPLLRKDLPTLVAQLAALPHAPELTLTTNAALLSKFAKPLKDAGLNRITVSLDALDDVVFKRMNDADYAVQQVLNGIDAALAAGFHHIKVNCVVQRSVNLNQVLPLAQHFRGSAVTLRFIEFMDVGSTNGWRMDEVVPSQELVSLIHAAHPISALGKQYAGEVAERWQYDDAKAGWGELGFISSVTQPFCADCSRLRLSTNGQLFTCLFAQQGWDVRSLLRDATVAHRSLLRAANLAYGCDAESGNEFYWRLALGFKSCRRPRQSVCHARPLRLIGQWLHGNGAVAHGV